MKYVYSLTQCEFLCLCFSPAMHASSNVVCSLFRVCSHVQQTSYTYCLLSHVTHLVVCEDLEQERLRKKQQHATMALELQRLRADVERLTAELSQSQARKPAACAATLASRAQPSPLRQRSSSLVTLALLPVGLAACR